MRRTFAALGAVASLALAGCGDDDGGGGDDAMPLVGEIDQAVTAVEDEVGSAQEYFEITASAQQVQLFVALKDATAVRQFVYIDDEVAPIGKAQSAEGQTFTADQLDFDPDTVLDQVVDELPSASLDTFSVIGSGDDVRYGIYATSAEGGQLDIIVDADGNVLEGGPADQDISPVTSPTGPPLTSPSSGSPTSTAAGSAGS